MAADTATRGYPVLRLFPSWRHPIRPAAHPGLVPQGIPAWCRKQAAAIGPGLRRADSGAPG